MPNVSKVILNGITLMDATSATATANEIVAPYTAMTADGVMTTGTASNSDGDSEGLHLLTTINVNAVHSIQIDINATWFSNYEYVAIVPDIVCSSSDWLYLSRDSQTSSDYTHGSFTSFDENFTVILKKGTDAYFGCWFRGYPGTSGPDILTFSNVTSYLYFYLYVASKTMTGTFTVYGIPIGADGGGGNDEEYIHFKITPSETVLTLEYDAGSFTLGTFYAVFAHSANSGNDPAHETIVDGGRYHLPYGEMASTSQNYGRITTRKVNSGSDYWNNPYITVTQTGTILSIKGENSHGWWMGGVEYSFYIQNINDWASR